MLGRHKHIEPTPVMRVRYSYSKATLGGYRIVDGQVACVVEVVSCEAVAASHCGHLNAGESRIDRHALIGCRVVPMLEGQS